MKSVVIVSGGMDSITLLYHLKEIGHEVKALGVNYGQRHAKELVAAAEICTKAEVHFEIANLQPINQFLQGSSQTSKDVQVPDGHYADESMKKTIVPNRNMIMLSVAIGWAVSLKYDAVAYGAHSGDHAIYPDCRPEFADAMATAASICDWNPIKLLSPFTGKTKSDIAVLGYRLGVPFDKTWSCYKGRALHCGLCGTCVERKEAFELAGLVDPTQYEGAVN